MESASIQEEAEWLGEQDGTPGMGEKIWSMAFELHAKANAQNTKRETLLNYTKKRFSRLMRQELQNPGQLTYRASNSVQSMTR